MVLVAVFGLVVNIIMIVVLGHNHDNGHCHSHDHGHGHVHDHEQGHEDNAQGGTLMCKGLVFMFLLI